MMQCLRASFLWCVLCYWGASSNHFAFAQVDDDDHLYHVAEYAPFVTFNNGAATTTAYCTATEMTLITSQVRQASSLGRSRVLSRLGGPKQRDLLVRCTPLLSWASSKCGGSTLHRRRQLYYSAYDDYTSGDDYLQGRQVYDETSGDDHPFTDDSTDDTAATDDYATFQCDSDTQTFNKVLDGLLPRLSAPCKAFVTKRSFECLETVDCDIKNMIVWNAEATTNDIYKLGAAQTYGTTDLVYCTSDRMDFQAKTTFDVGGIKFTMTGPNGYNTKTMDYESPYFMFGSQGVTGLVGTKLKAGKYTLVAAATNEPLERQTVHFSIVLC